MNLKEIMNLLEEAGTAQNRKIYKRHGAKEPLFGVSFANLNKFKKMIKKDHEFGLQLWATKNTDAMILATMIMEPSKITRDLLLSMVKEITYYVLMDQFTSNLVFPSEHAMELMEKWIVSSDEWIGRAGWNILNQFALKNTDLGDDFFIPYLKEIEKTIKSKKNRTKESMNYTLIAIGMRSKRLRELAFKISDCLGKIEVDHGETSCKTPLAREYIERALNRMKKSSKKSSKKSNKKPNKKPGKKSRA